MNTAVHFSSASDDWSTPQDLFDQLNEEHGPFDLDVCATPKNAKCARFYTKKDDGLIMPWTGRVWCNPPYGRSIGLWVKKAAAEAGRLCYGPEGGGEEYTRVVCLLPARTDTKWWHDYIQPILDHKRGPYGSACGSVRFLKGRLKFGGSRNSAPFPSVVVVFR